MGTLTSSDGEASTATAPAVASPDGEAGSAAAVAAPAGPSARGWLPAVGKHGLPLPLALLAALAGGLALAAAFPPTAIWPLAPAGPALLVLALWRRSLPASLVAGLVFGLAFFVPLLSWLVNVAWYVWLVLAAAEALIFAALTLAQRLLLRLPAWPLAVAGWWVTAEALRGRWPYAFPWGRLAMSQAGAPTAPWAAVGGVSLLSLLLALAGTTLAWLLLGPASGPRRDRQHRRPWEDRQDRRTREDRQDRQDRRTREDRQDREDRWTWEDRQDRRQQEDRQDRRSRKGQEARRTLEGQEDWRPRRPWRAWRGRAPRAVAFAAAVGLVLAGGLLPAGQRPPGTPTAEVAAIQGGVPHARNLPGLLRATTVTARHVAATRRLAGQVSAGRQPAPDLVVWPENSTDLDPRFYPSAYAAIRSAVTAIGRPVLVGEVLQDPQRNVGQLWLPGSGPGPLYVKRQLVPFGEYIPFRHLLAHITPLVALQPHDFTPGHRAVVFRLHRIRLGDVICYEVGFDGLVSSEVKAGANLLAVQTNDASFMVDGQLGETLQQLAMARIRAVESDRAVIYASTSGVSAIIAPDGSILARSGIWRQTVLEARVPLVSSLTLADRVGAWPEALIIALTLVALGWAAAGGIALRRRAGRPAVSPQHR